MLLFTVPASVNVLLFVRQQKHLIQLRFNGGDAARIRAFDNVSKHFRHRKLSFFSHYAVFDYVYRYVAVDIS